MIHKQSLIEMSLGAAIGAVTFTGSIIAFLKLDGRMSGAPILLPARHVINIALAVALVAAVVMFYAAPTATLFWIIVLAIPFSLLTVLTFGFLAWLFALPIIWYLYRMIKGVLRLNEGQPMPE